MASKKTKTLNGNVPHRGKMGKLHSLWKICMIGNEEAY